jgi:hypothetical protein
MSESAELNFEHNGTQYLVIVNYQVKTIDDSFDGHLGGCVYTFESSHTEVDLDSVDVESCIGENDEEINPKSVPGLMSCILGILEDNPEKYA